MTNDEMTRKNYDLLMNELCPWGSLDVWHMIKHAEACNIHMSELVEILQNGAENWGINLYNRLTDVNSLLNDYILSQASEEIENLTNINIDEMGVYYFANYLDCPLQYGEEVADILTDAVIDKKLIRNDFSPIALYVLDEMGINIPV